MKKCNKCNIEKPLDEFYKHKGGKLGRRSDCKECKKAYQEANKDKIRARKKTYYEANKDKALKARKTYYEANKEKIAEQKKAYREANKERIAERKKQYYQANKKRIAEWHRRYKKARRKSDPLFKLSCNYRTLLGNTLKRGSYSKKSRTHEILGIDYERYKKYLEATFKKGMSWDNHGEWHIDHIIPLASAKNEEELLKLLHYSNTQPLWAEDNIKKRDRILEPTQVKLRI